MNPPNKIFYKGVLLAVNVEEEQRYRLSPFHFFGEEKKNKELFSYKECLKIDAYYKCKAFIESYFKYSFVYEKYKDYLTEYAEQVEITLGCIVGDYNKNTFFETPPTINTNCVLEYAQFNVIERIKTLKIVSLKDLETFGEFAIKMIKTLSTNNGLFSPIFYENRRWTAMAIMYYGMAGFVRRDNDLPIPQDNDFYLLLIQDQEENEEI